MISTQWEHGFVSRVRTMGSVVTLSQVRAQRMRGVLTMFKAYAQCYPGVWPLAGQRSEGPSLWLPVSIKRPLVGFSLKVAWPGR